MSVPTRRLPTVSGGSPAKQHVAVRLHPDGSDQMGTEVGFVNGGSSCVINAITAILLRIPHPERASAPHPFVSHYLDPSIMVAQPGSVSAEFSRLARALHADQHRGGVESGVLTAPAPLCTSQLRAALASYAADVGAQAQFSAVGPADAVDVTELLLQALHEQWRSKEQVAHASPEAAAGQVAAELIAQAVVSPYPSLVHRGIGDTGNFARGLWLRVPSPALRQSFTVALQRLLTRAARTTLAMIYTLEAERDGAISDLSAVLREAARVPDGSEIVMYSVVDGQLWERLPTARALCELHAEQTIMAFEIVPAETAASYHGVWRDGIPLVHRAAGCVVPEGVPTLLQRPANVLDEGQSGNPGCWHAELHSLAWRVVAERWVEGLPRGDSRVLPTSGCELKVMVRHVVGEGVPLSPLSQPAANGEDAAVASTILAAIGRENLIVVADWRCDAGTAAEGAKRVCGVLEPWSVVLQSRISRLSVCRQPRLQQLLDNALQEQQQEEKQHKGTVVCRIGCCVCGDAGLCTSSGGCTVVGSMPRCNAYPPLLCLHLGRYLLDKDGSTLKRDTTIVCPLQGLRVGQYEYELFGVIDLLGPASSTAGHFVATVRIDRRRDYSIHNDLEQHTWVCFDDTRVRACSGPPVSNDSYILFYVRTERR